jgi:hypothetical protein
MRNIFTQILFISKTKNRSLQRLRTRSYTRIHSYVRMHTHIKTSSVTTSYHVHGIHTHTCIHADANYHSHSLSICFPFSARSRSLKTTSPNSEQRPMMQHQHSAKRRPWKKRSVSRCPRSLRRLAEGSVLVFSSSGMRASYMYTIIMWFKLRICSAACLASILLTSPSL